MRSQSSINNAGKNGRPAKASSEASRSRALLFARELARWDIGSRAPLQSGRWSRWAQKIAGRHRTLASIWGASGLEFIDHRTGSQVVNRIVSQRWLASMNLYPRIQLSLQKVFARIPALSERVIVPGRDLRETRRNPLAPPANVPETAIYKGWPRFEYSTAAAPARSREPHYQNSNRDSKPNPVEISRATAPLVRVFRRLESEDDLFVTRMGGRSIEETGVATTQRIVRNCLRVEERSVRSFVPAPAVVYKQSAPHVEISARDLDGVLPEPMPRPAQAPFINVDELTSHVIREIDQRTTAWRERMGKI